MNRQEKQLMVKGLEKDFKQYQSSFLVGVKGLTVQDMQGLRRGVHDKGGKMLIAKNTLLKRAISDNPKLSYLEPYFKDQIGIVFTSDAPQVAKLLFKTSKKNKNLTLVAGSLNDKPLDTANIKYLATLPSREVLLAQVARSLKAPVTAYVNVLNKLILRFLWVLKEVKDKKEQ